MRPKLKDRRGLTLIEVIVVLAIFGVVLSVAYSLLGFSRNTLSVSNTQFDVQNDVRLTAGYVSQEVRFAREIKIIDLSSVTTGMAAHQANYSFFYLKDGALRHAKYVNSTTYEEHSYGTFLATASNKSYFKKVAADKLKIQLTAEQGGKSYDIATELKLENLTLSGSAIDISGLTGGLTQGQAIRYKT